MTSSAAEETLAAGSLLATTHVHDNNGRQDSHDPPGYGTVDWKIGAAHSTKSAIQDRSCSSAFASFVITHQATGPRFWQLC